MIAYLEGIVIRTDPQSIVLNVSGVGYRIFVSEQTKLCYHEGSDASVWIYTAQSDSATRLYGFRTPEELAFFELLITVSGIGPKTALGILNVASVNTIRQAVLENNTAHLTKVSGIGKKNAEKIVLELRDKVEKTEYAPNTPTLSGDEDVIDALLALGYSQREVRNALQKLSPDIEGTENKIREALKHVHV